MKWLLPGLALAGCAKPDRIDALALHTALEERPTEYYVVDVRSRAEFNARGGHIVGATHIPYPGVKTRTHEITASPHQTVVLICLTGHRSRWALRAVREAVEATVVDLRGGMVAWWQKKLPVESSTKD